ncbi:sulfite exporter TauE/SafE family protein [Nonomuraea sp. NPDC049028]|uniref:sulfite exporter TauE/SafE family protein n=1 Tax=Nonomuraea sp. NPDC049028 TaxID=3364348 RepID=UPI003710654E
MVIDAVYASASDAAFVPTSVIDGTFALTSMIDARFALTLAAACAAAFVLAVVSAVAGFGGGVLLLPVFTALFGLRVAVPMLTLAQLASNGSRVVFNRRELRWSLVGWFALGAVPLAVAGGLLLAHAPLGPLKRLLGVFLLVVVAWRRLRPHPRSPADPAFAAVGAASGLGSALLGSVGPLTAPFFLAYGLTRAAYIGTEAASALVMHLAKIAAYGAGDLLGWRVLTYGAALTPATLAGAWLGKKIVARVSDGVFVVAVEAGLVVAGVLLLIGL